MSEGNNEPTEVYRGKYLALMARDRWEYVRRVRSSGVVGIVAVTEAGELILIEQFRPPLQARVLEIPAGLSGDIAGEEHESLETAARRELEEETGFEAELMERVTSGPSSAGLSSEVMTIFRARGLRRTGQGGGDASEDIVTHLVPLDQVPDFIADRARAGVFVDPKVWAALALSQR